MSKERWYLEFTWTCPGGAGLGGDSLEVSRIPITAAENSNEALAQGKEILASVRIEAEKHGDMHDIRNAQITCKISL